MVITPHMLVGAAVGAQSPNVWAAFIFGLLSHFLLDMLPHWDYLDRLKITKIVDLIKIGLDFILGTIIVLVFVWTFPQKLLIIFAIAGALLPDILVFLYAHLKIKWLKPFFQFHHKVHYCKRLSFWQGFPSALIIIVVSILFLNKWG